jgi:tetratricopeptide (TPR) repeat protein
MTLQEAMATIKARPKDPDAWVALGDALAQAGETTKARDSYNRALAIDPSHAGALGGAALLDSPPTPSSLAPWLQPQSPAHESQSRSPSSSHSPPQSMPVIRDGRAICPECGYANSTERRVCKKCKTPMPGKEPLPTEAKSSANQRLLAGVIITALALAVIVGLAAVRQPRAVETRPSQILNTGSFGSEAYSFCKLAIIESLKAPSTAEFPFSEYIATHNGNDKYTVEGYVDAQNSFGAMIRSDWTCVVLRRGFNNFEILDVAIEAR